MKQILTFLGFTFHPFTICKWVLESEIKNISIVENLPRLFSGYVYIKDTNFCNHKFCSSSKFSNISLLKFAAKFTKLNKKWSANLPFMFHPNLSQSISTIWSQPERGVIYMYTEIKNKKNEITQLKTHTN